MGKPNLWVIGAGIVVAFVAGAATLPLGNWMLLPITVGVLGPLAAVAWRRGRGTSEQVTVTPNLVLIALPTIIGAWTISVAAGGVLACVAVVIFWIRPDRGLDLAWPCAILPIIGLAIVLRPNPPSTTIAIALFTLVLIVTVRAVHLSASRLSALVSMVDGIGVFLVVSVALRFIGVGDAERAVDEVGNSLTGGLRYGFPLSNSQAATPAVAAVYLAAVAPILITTRQYRVPRLLGVLPAVYVLVLADRRAALIGGLIIAACTLLAPRQFRRVGPWLAGALMLTPFFYSYIRGAVGQVMSTGYAPGLMRPGEDADSLNGRDYIWSRSLNFYLSRVDELHQWFGYGSYGHAKSGVSAYYSGMFGNSYHDRQLLTPHNSVLQTLFDGGWVTTLAFVAVIIWIAVVLSRRDSNLVGLAMLTALAVVGTTEVGLSPTYAQPTWWLLVALGVVAFSREPAAVHNSEFSAESRAILGLASISAASAWLRK